MSGSQVELGWSIRVNTGVVSVVALRDRDCILVQFFFDRFHDIVKLG